MDQARLPPLAGIAAAVVVLVLLAVPYLLVDPASSVATYYASGSITPLITGLFALLSIVIFAAGREERTDPALAAGATLVMGAFGFVVAVVWAVTVSGEIVSSLDVTALFAYHRFVVAIAALGLPIAAGWYARALRLI